MKLEGRVCVVTGASTGIGLAVALRLAREKARVAICARGKAALEEAAARVRAAGGEALAVPADVTREAEVERFAARVREALGPAEVLVNNAGVGLFRPFHESTIEDFDRIFAVNVRGLVLSSLAFVPEMVRRGEGVVVNVASIAGKVSFAGGAAYAGSKHAVMGISRAMMLDLRPHGVRVLTVCPGSVDTPFFRKARHDGPEPGKAMRPEDVAEMIVRAVEIADRATVSDLEMRPVNP